MLELALHILDIAENALRAGATCLEITVTEDTKADMLKIEISDNGHGMNSDVLERACDPFFTTKDVRHIGLGLPLLAQAAKTAGGDFILESEEGKGTSVIATFRYSHIDRQPLGDIPGCLAALIPGHPDVDILFAYHRNVRHFIFDTRTVRAELDEVPLDHPDIIEFIRTTIRQGLDELVVE